MTKAASEQFCTCRKFVHDDAFEAQITARMATPLLSGAVNKLKGDYHPVGIFLRRALTRYLAITLSRLLDKPGKGRTGETASIASLLDMAKSERILDKRQIQHFISNFETVKVGAAQEEYDMVQALRDLRNIHLAHRLIPWIDPTDVWGHHLLEFAEAIFHFVMRLDLALAEATGITLADSRKGAEDFEVSVKQFWQAMISPH